MSTYLEQVEQITRRGAAVVGWKPLGGSCLVQGGTDMRIIKRLFALGAAVAVIGVFAAPAQAGAPPPVPQRASAYFTVQCAIDGDGTAIVNYPAAPSLEGQQTSQDAFNKHGGVALGEFCEVVVP